jgi:hypothetical protein
MKYLKYLKYLKHLLVVATDQAPAGGDLLQAQVDTLGCVVLAGRLRASEGSTPSLSAGQNGPR